jgi:hypothetical protein
MNEHKNGGFQPAASSAQRKALLFELGTEVTINPEAGAFQFDPDEPDVDGLTFHMKTGAAIDSDAGAITIDPDVDAVVVKYEFIIVDAEKQTTRCVISISPDWDF